MVLVFDADAGGRQGVDRALEDLLVAQDVELAVATLPEGLDPCDLLVQAGRSRDVSRRRSTDAKDALDFRLDWLLEKNPAPNVETTRRIVDDMLGTLAIADPARSVQTQVKRELIVTRLAHRLGLAAGDSLGAAVRVAKGASFKTARAARWSRVPRRG